MDSPNTLRKMEKCTSMSPLYIYIYSTCIDLVIVSQVIRSVSGFSSLMFQFNAENSKRASEHQLEPSAPKNG